MDFIIFLLIGALAGWLASYFMKGRGLSMIGNILAGIVGALIGGILFGSFGFFDGGVLDSVITATVGSLVLLFIISFIKKAKKA